MQSKLIPLLVIFTLDKVFWPYYQDSQFNAPFSRNSSTGEIFDARGTKITYYEDVPKVLAKLKNEGVMIAIAALTRHLNESHQILEWLGWDKYITYKEISQWCATEQLKRLHDMTKVDFSDMLYFTQNEAIVRLAAKIDVIGVNAENGITLEALEAGLQHFKSIRFNKVNTTGSR